MKLEKPRILVAGVASDVGKTTVATGLMACFRKKGLRVQGFKVGPDFLDPTYHSLVTQRASRNLDTWLMGEQGVLETFAHSTKDADIAVIEGVMGLFDGSSAKSDEQSSAEIARLLNTPVLLVLDVYALGRSAAALVAGCVHMGKGLRISGVILNRVGSQKHAQLCKDAIEHETKVPVLGWLPNNEQISLPSRHLGLFAADSSMDNKLKAIQQSVEKNVEIERVLAIAKDAPPLEIQEQKSLQNGKEVKIGIAMDESFFFYYEDNFDILRALGAKLLFFSPCNDSALPEVDALLIGGGYPEINAQKLEENVSMRNAILKFIEQGGLVYAECGGLMYLGRTTSSTEGRVHYMVGALELDTRLTKELTLGYTELEGVTQSALSAKGEILKGHEFHYSKVADIDEDARFCYKVRKGRGIKDSMEGYLVYNTLASYTHLHFRGNLSFAQRLLKNASHKRD